MRFQRPPFHHRNVPEPLHRHEVDDDEGSAAEESEAESRPESEYLRRLTGEHTPVVVHLRSGENFAGYIEYYDRRFIRLTREGAPNLFIYKDDIKYLSEG